MTDLRTEIIGKLAIVLYNMVREKPDEEGSILEEVKYITSNDLLTGIDEIRKQMATSNDRIRMSMQQLTSGLDKIREKADKDNEEYQNRVTYMKKRD